MQLRNVEGLCSSITVDSVVICETRLNTVRVERWTPGVQTASRPPHTPCHRARFCNTLNGAQQEQLHDCNDVIGQSNVTCDT